MRILMFATEGHGGFGGIAQYNRDVIDALCNSQFVTEVVVLTRLIPEAGFKHPSKVKYDLVSATGLGHFISRSVAHGFRKYDMIYCAHINLLPFAAAVARARRLPLVLAIYGVDAWSRPKFLVGRFSIGGVSLVLSISQLTLDRFRSWSGFAAEKSALLPNAIHKESFAIGKKDNSLSRGLGIAGQPAILTFGRMSADEQYKGFDEVLEVLPSLINHVPNLVYVAAGDGSDRSRLEEKARVLGVADHVIFCGRVKESDKADLYQLSDVYVMPSSGEGFGFVVLEALASGVPVVASLIDGTREALLDGELGILIDPKDSQGLEDAILKALSRPKMIPSRLEHFSFKNFEMRLEAAIHRVLPINS